MKPGAEFNVFADPEAASFVLSKAGPGTRITLFPLETSRRAAFSKVSAEFPEPPYPTPSDPSLLSQEFRLRMLGTIGSREADFLNKAERISLSEPGDDWVYYDPLGAFYLERPCLAKAVALGRVAVETGHGPSRGATIVDLDAPGGYVRVVTDVDKEALRHLMIRAFS